MYVVLPPEAYGSISATWTTYGQLLALLPTLQGRQFRISTTYSARLVFNSALCGCIASGWTVLLPGPSVAASWATLQLGAGLCQDLSRCWYLQYKDMGPPADIFEDHHRYECH